MTVFIVTEYSTSEETVIRGVFDNYEKAKEYVHALLKEYLRPMKCEVDEDKWFADYEVYRIQEKEVQ